jgi:hypothetical protein
MDQEDFEGDQGEYDGDFSDLQDEDEGWDEEDGADEELEEDLEGEDAPDEEEELLDAPSEPTKKKRAVAEEDKENVVITEKFFSRMVTQLETKPGQGSLKLFLQIFVDLLGEQNTDKFRKRTFTVLELDLLRTVLDFGVHRFPEILVKALGIKSKADGVSISKEKGKVLAKTLANCLSKYLSQQTEAGMVATIARAIRKHVVIFGLSRQKTLKLVTICLELWGNQDAINAKLETLLLLRDLCTFVDNNSYEKVMKKAYLTYISSCTSVTWRNYDLVSFMTNGLVELFRCRSDISYILVFNILQGIAGKTKGLYTANDAEKIKKLFNWKTLNTLRFIAKAVCAMGREAPDYGQLVYPTIETLRAIACLFPALQYIPFRLHILRLLVELGEECNTNIPLFDIFLQMLKTQHFMAKKKYTKAIASADPEITVKLSKEHLGSQDLWEGIFASFTDLLMIYISLPCTTPYFPEFAVLLFRLLNSVRKLTENPSLRSHLKRVLGFVKEAFKDRIQARKGKKLEDNVPSKNPSLLKERERIKAERKNMIKMKVMAEKEEDENELNRQGEEDDIENGVQDD